ncbi:MAG: ATP-binding protein [Bacillus sp. (in: Bacteria)]|nr:ATP-binding protein [Bacillus sp. (in: firmicutes)]
MPVTEKLNIRSYLGVPIFYKNGDMFGTLCAMDSKPANFSKSDQEQLEKYAALFSYVVELERESMEKKALYEKAERAQKINQEIIDNVNEGIQFVDREGRLVQYNEKLKNFYPMAENWMNAPFSLWSKEITEKLEKSDRLFHFLEENIFSIGDKEAEFQYNFSTSDMRRMEVYGESVYRNQEKIGTLFVHRDVTAEYEVDKLKSELVSTVSHELRTPLASVLGFTELLLTKDLKRERQKQYIQTIHKEAHRLTKLINDFLDLQRMEAGVQTYVKERVQLEELIVDVIETFRSSNKNHQFFLKNQVNTPYILGDEEKLIQLFTNLIGNAVKFSPDGGMITISINKKNNQLIIHVADDGLGIPEEALPKLFQKFQRIDNSDRRKIGGTGLGLAICKEIVSGHDGDITVRTELGKGTVFTLYFPILEDITSEHTEEGTKLLPKIVILEDDSSLGSLLKDELEDVGFAVYHFLNDETFLEKVVTIAPVGIVVDLILDGEPKGWEIVKELKTHPETEHIPIFISSALEEKEKGLHWNISNYLLKPYSPHKLSTVILQTLLHDKKGEILFPAQD